jgi:hypothetical protein
MKEAAMTDERKTADPKPVDRKLGDTAPWDFKGGNEAGPGTGEIFGTVMKQVSDGIAVAAKRGDVPLLDAVGNVVRNAMRGALGTGGNPGLAAKAIMMGVVRGTGHKEAEALRNLAHAARIVVHQTAEMNGDLGAVATALVQGATADSARMGVGSARAADAVREAVFEEADRIGSVAAERVRGALKKAGGGIPAAS